MKFCTITLWLALTAGIVMILTTGCTRDIAGATTETTNGVSGAIRNNDSSPAPNTVVRLIPDEYNPVTDSSGGGSFIDTTDNNGFYRFSRVAAGRYVVLARNRIAATSFLVRNVISNNDSLTTAPEGTLSRSGSISADFSLAGAAAGGYVYIPGTDITASIGSDGSAVLADVPPGTITAVILASGNNEKRNVLRNEIVVAADAVVIIDQPLWKYRSRFGLNTTPAGADVAGNVYNFPVLVRLNSGNFNFSQARGDGGDLLFTGNSNVVLPFEIERWDAGAMHAEMWVKVDTIRGNDSVQSITMYWGNPDAALQSTSGGVFDTADGYLGVWHMGDNAPDSVRDATVNRYSGGSPDTASPAVAEGAIGDCRLFDGKSDFITMPNTAAGKLNFPESGQYTVSAWVLLDTLDGASHCIVSKGYEQYYLRSTYISKNLTFATPLWEFVEFGETVKWQTSTSTASSRQWSLLTGVRQGGRQLLYCNGVLVNSTIEGWQNAVSRNMSNDLFIGRFAKAVTVPISEGYCYYRGSIDEVRIISASQSPDWVRLCYMNQRPDDRLTVFK